MENKWIGEICDICGKEIGAADEVAVCPDCGAPYHRACIIEKGACVHRDLHEAGKEWQSSKQQAAAKEPDGIPCMHCMSVNRRDARFCSQCGAPIASGQMPPRIHPFEAGEESEKSEQRPGAEFGMFGDPQFIKRIVLDPFGGLKPDEQIEEGVTAKEAATYVKKNPNYFLPRFRSAKYRIPGLNFSAFLFGGLYYIYRKVYGMGALLLLTQLVLTVPAFIVGIFYATEMVGIKLPLELNMNVISNIDVICSMFRMGLMFLSGFLFNRVYKGHVVGKVKKLKARFPDPKRALQEISARGGVNLGLIIVLLVAYFSLYYAVIVSIVQVFGK